MTPEHQLHTPKTVEINATTVARVGEHRKRVLRLSARELLRREIKTEQIEDIPVKDIVLEDAIVFDEHVDELADSIHTNKRGQVSPLTVRARDVGIKGIIHYDVIDGFHRSYALQKLGIKYAEAKVLYGCNDEELYDLRVMSANSVTAVKFARVAKWMQYSYSLTEWAKKGLTLSQALGIVVQDTSGVILGLDEKEVNRLKKWANEKARKWHQPVSTIYLNMKAIEVAAPDLVSKVRIRGGGKDRKGVFTRARFLALIGQLPNDWNLQRRVYEVIVEHNLIEREVSALAKSVADNRDNPTKLEKIFAEPLLHMQLYMDSTDTVSRPAKRKSKNVIKKERNLSTSSPDNIFWWRSFKDLSANEKTALVLCFEQGQDLAEVANKLVTTEIQVFSLIKSAFRKYVISREIV